jgi:hypothetical protein
MKITIELTDNEALYLMETADMFYLANQNQVDIHLNPYNGSVYNSVDASSACRKTREAIREAANRVGLH